jgi:hypothetical protein
MWNRRWVAAWATWLAVGGAIGGTVAHALYYRSDLYRHRVEARLTRFFGLPTYLEEVEPYSFTARQFTGVELWLPDKRDVVFRSPRVVWDTYAGPEASGTVIDVYHSTWSLGSANWEKPDYERVLQASLRHNFREINLREVRFHQARLTWLRPDCRLLAEGVDGKLVFDSEDHGQADLVCYRLNGFSVTDPIRISARVDPRSDELLPEVNLTVPGFPMAALGLDQILQSHVSQGSFSGRITFLRTAVGDVISLAGHASGARLEEWTRRVPGGAIPGLLDLTIEEARIEDHRLEHLRFRGEAGELDADALLARVGWPDIGGTVRVKVLDAALSDSAVQRLVVSGQWTGGSLDKLSEKLLGKTGLHGKLRARINSLALENNEIVSGDLELAAEPLDGRAGTVDRALLLEAFKKYAGISLPTSLQSLLPGRVDYVQLGIRILIDRQQVRVFSGRGPAGPALITVRVFGQDLPIGGDLDLSFPLSEVMHQAVGRIDSLKQRLERPSSTAVSTAPARR